MKPLFHFRKYFWSILLLLSSRIVMAQTTTVSSPIYLPLVYEANDGKWAIELSLGGGSTPAPFEFDTGGTGFYAAYSPNTSSSSWWGINVTPTGTPAYNYYDSGETYTGSVVQTAVTFWSNSTALVNTPGNVTVGQITNISQNGVTNWASTSVMTTNQTPPVQGNFFGDFGLSLNLNTNYSYNPLENLIAQMTFTNGVTAGFVVNMQSNNPYLQIGLNSSQTNMSGATYFAMNSDTNAGSKTFANTGLAYHSEQIFSTTLTLSNSAASANIVLTNVGITPDTGAGVTIHNTAANTNFPTNWVIPKSTDLITNDQGIFTNTNYFPIIGDLTLTSTNGSGGSNVVFDVGSTAIQNKPPQLTTYSDFYLNAGREIFDQNVIIYDLQNNKIGLIPQAVPEPSVAWLILAGFGTVLIASLKRKFLGLQTSRQRHCP